MFMENLKTVTSKFEQGLVGADLSAAQRAMGELPSYCKDGCKLAGSCAATLFVVQRVIKGRGGGTFVDFADALPTTLSVAKGCAKLNGKLAAEDVRYAAGLAVRGNETL
jgi:hypothetical protein